MAAPVAAVGRRRGFGLRDEFVDVHDDRAQTGSDLKVGIHPKTARPVLDGAADLNAAVALSAAQYPDRILGAAALNPLCRAVGVREM